ncbi:hypothetical protein ACN47E_004811 [Coniothyrium glycines]
MKVNWIHPVRGVQAGLSIAVLGLMGYVASWWTTHWRQMAPSEVHFLVFAPAWSLLALVPLILVPLKFNHLLSTPAGRYGMVGLEGLTMLFWFSGFIALAVFLSDRICFGMVCDVARASAGLSALTWVAFTVTFVVGVIDLVKSLSKPAPLIKEVEMHQGV